MAQSNAFDNVVKLNNIVNVKAPQYGAKGDGTTDDTTAIQNALTDVAGAGGWHNTSGIRGKLFFPHGVYKTTAQLTIPSSTWITFEGESRKGTYIFQRDGTGACVQVLGSPQTADPANSNNDGGVIVRDISLGSTVGHALQFKNAYNAQAERVSLFCAEAASNYLDLDGVSVFVGNDIRTDGNDDYPYEYAAVLEDIRSVIHGLYGVEVTVRVAGGLYNGAGEITLNDLYVGGYQSSDAVYIHTPTAAGFQIYPVILNNPHIAGPNTNDKSLIKADLSIVYVNGGYGERNNALVTGTNAIEVCSTQGDTTVYVNNFIAQVCDLFLNGDNINKPSLIVKGGNYKTWRSSFARYGEFRMQDVRFVSRTASALATWTQGDITRHEGMHLDDFTDLDRGTWTPTVTGWTGTPTATGTYQTQGNMVFVNAQFVPTTGNHGTSGAYISNLPYQSYYPSALVSIYNKDTNTNFGAGSISSGSLQAYLPNSGITTASIGFSAYYQINASTGAVSTGST